MKAPATAQPHAPLIEMNMTPLIDVLLVLLVMFIITIPLQTHAVKLDLARAELPVLPIRERANLLTITAPGQLLWNGSPLTMEQLPRQLRVSRQMSSVPELHLRPDANAPYGLVDEVLATIKREGVERFGFVGNEAYADIG